MTRPCHKRRYEEEIQARRAAMMIITCSPTYSSPGEYYTISTYLCPQCNAWHWGHSLTPSRDRDRASPQEVTP
jgi:hypothetical protein